MHPILARAGRLGPYLAAWVPFGALVAVLAHMAAGSPWLEAFLLSLPLALVYAFICLASYYPCRAVPVGRTPFLSLIATHLLAALLCAVLWLFLAMTWAVMLETVPEFAGVTERFPRLVVVLAVAAVLLYTVMAAVHYALISAEETAARERRQLELEMAAREAELRALRAQVDPHFLFNAMNAIASLTSSDPAAARQMCLDLAEFLRSSLRLGARATIPLAEELALAERYLAVESRRFGGRLRVRKEVDEAAGACLVPPLILQPLVENAVKHGIAELVDGGEVRVTASRQGERVVVTVDNPCDPNGAPGPGEGVGLANVRSRLTACYGSSAAMEVQRQADAHRVQLLLPAAVPTGLGQGEDGG